jgi:hypothetical protein
LKNRTKESEEILRFFLFYKSVLKISLRQNEEATLAIDSPGRTKLIHNRNRAIEKAIKRLCEYFQIEQMEQSTVIPKSKLKIVKPHYG